MRVSLLPVLSQLADPAAVPSEVAERLPSGWQLSQHQLDTYHALIDDTVDVVINTAMTGDGKSLAGLLPLLVQRYPTLALYPTNELIRDQHASATHALELWQRPARWVDRLDSTVLDKKTEELEHTRRGDAIEQMFKQHRLVLSNPDIFHAVLQFFYQQPGRAPDWLAGRVGDMFQQLTFDEFHIFGVAEVVAVLTALLFLYEQAPGRFKTLFLSATPDSLLLPAMQQAGLRVRQIETSSTYHHGADAGAGWRRILHGCELHFDTLRAEEWVEAHLEDVLLPFFRQHQPGAKGAIIVNSVAAAHRLDARLRPRLASEGLSVLTNTGMTGRSERRASYAADVLIATSTVDVGVDFQINFLVFEASTDATFLQRLGRLGRHSGYTRDGGYHSFPVFYACALVPEFVQERLFVGHRDEPALLSDGVTLPRNELQTALVAAYPPLASFPRYIRHWGRFLPAHVMMQLSDPKIRDTYATTREQLQQRYEQTFALRLSKAWGFGKRMREEGQGKLLEEARSFRGGSPFACAVLVPATTTAGGVVYEPLVYDLFYLLANAELEWMEEQAFLDAASDYEDRLAAIRRAKPVAYLRLLRYREERTDVMVMLLPEESNWGTERHESAQVLSGIKVEAAGVEWLNELNRRLQRRQVVGLFIPGRHPLEVRRLLRLPLVFPLHKYQDMYGAEGCIAFARQALLLDTMLRYRPLAQPGDEKAIVL
jgi:CRISPR-associated endonuclease/helicase Cas3